MKKESNIKQKLLAIFVILAVVLSFLSILVPVPVLADSVIINTVKDTYICGGPLSKGTNYGDATRLLTGSFILGIDPNRTLISFSIFEGSPIPSGAQIVSAYLQLYWFQGSSSQILYAQRLLVPSWVESVANWQRYAYNLNWWTEGASSLVYDYTTTDQATALLNDLGWVDWDITAQVQWAWANYSNVHLRIVNDTEYANLSYFYSSEYSDTSKQPRLVVNYILPSNLVVTTGTATDITTDSATCHGNVVSTGGYVVTRRGIQYGLTQTPTWDSYETGNFDVGSYSRTLVSLEDNTTYWYRAYAVNSKGTAYGEWLSFVTYEEGVSTECEDFPESGSGITDDPYIIMDICQLNWIGGDSTEYPEATRRSAHYKLGDDIDASETLMWYWSVDKYLGFRPIGDSITAFSGTFDGQDYNITDLYINRPATDHVGLFAYASGASMVIKDINRLSSVDVTGSYYVGGLLGYAGPKGDVSGCVVSGAVQGVNDVGLVVGWAEGDGSVDTMTVSDCGAIGAVTGSNQIGGFVGRSNGGNYIYDCYAHVNVSGGSTEDAHHFIGGFAGLVFSGDIQQCYADGSVQGNHSGLYRTKVGGFAGSIYNGYIEDCYALGSVSGYNPTNPIYAYVGGFVGELESHDAGDAEIYNCYSTGYVTGTSGGYLKGFCGFEEGSWNTYSDNFWDTQTSGRATSECATGKTTSQMKDIATFSAWDIEMSIVYLNDGYPFLGWQIEGASIWYIAGECEYLLETSSSEGGSVNTPGEGSFCYENEEVVGIVAVEEEGYLFTVWTGDVGTVGDIYNPSTTITMYDSYIITANFEVASRSLYISSTPGGSVTTPGEGMFYYDADEVVNIVAEADEGYAFVSWTGDTSTITDIEDPTTTITMSDSYVIKASFVYAELHSLTISSTNGGSVTTPGEGSFAYPYGTMVDLVATTDEDYWFYEWTGTIGSIENPRSATTTIFIDDDYSIVANFVEEEEPPLGAPVVVTHNATSITAMSASLHGELTSLGDYDTAYVFFQYGTDISYGTNTPEQPRGSVGNFARTISSLSPSTEYHFRAVARYGSFVYGEDIAFNTTDEGGYEPPGYEYRDCSGTYEYESYEFGDDATAVVYGANWFTQTFVPEEAFKLDYVRLKLLRVGAPGVMTVSIRNVDDLGKPIGVDLTSATFEGVGASDGWYEIDLPDYRLETNTYAIVVRAVAGDVDNYIGWRYDGTGTYIDGAYVSSLNSGVSWSLDEDKDFLFSTYGTSVLCIMDAQVFSGYLEEDDWLITIHYLNEFPPYYGSATPGDYFDLQLIANNVTIASVGLPLWGNMPGSIYLSKELADGLEWGSTYTVRMRGRFDPYPSASWILTPSDWKGEDLNRLDDWVLEVADEMSSYYATSTTVYMMNKKVLNDVGAVFFSIGIPMLAAVRPDIFQNPTLWIPYSEEEIARDYEEQMYQFREAVGDTIADDADTVGGLFNLTGSQIVAVAITGGWIITAVGLASVVGAVGLIVTIPLALIGVMVGALPTTLFAIVGALFVVVFALYTWFNRS